MFRLDLRAIILAIIVIVAIVVVFAVWWNIRVNNNPNIPPPTSLAAETKNNTIHLTWDAVPNASGYNVYISKSAGLTKQNAATKVTVSSNNTTLNLAPGVYFFVVSTLRVCNGITKESANLSNEATARTPSCTNTNLSPPGTLVAEDVGSGQIELAWTGVIDAVAYNVYRAQGRAVSVKDFDQVFKTDTTEIVFTGLTSGTKQSFIVTTLDACGKETAPSNQIQLIVDCATPIQPQISAVTSSSRSINVKWAAVDGVTQYVAYIKKGPAVAFNSFDLRQPIASTIQSFTFNGLHHETEYAVGISGINSCGEGQMNLAVTSTKSLVLGNQAITPKADMQKNAKHSPKGRGGSNRTTPTRVGDHKFLPLASR